jgi:hypothetical protein
MENLNFADYITDNAYSELELPVFLIKDENEANSFYINNIGKLVEIFIKSIKMALNDDLLVVPLFKLLFSYQGAKYITLILKRDKFDNVLQKCLDYFHETEQYERCTEIIKLINNER